MKRRLKIMPIGEEDLANNIQGPSLENKMKRIILFAILILLLTPSLVFAQNEKKKALYFYAENGSLCDEVDEYFSSQGLYEKYSLEKIEVSGPYNMKYLNEFFDVFGVKAEKRGWPAIVFGDEMLIGSQSIMEKFSEDMEKYGRIGTPIPLEIRKKLEQKEKGITDANEARKNVSLPFIFSAGMIDSVSPCSLTAVVILLSLLLFARRGKNVFSIGAFFILGIFLVYFSIGLVSVEFLWKISRFSKAISVTMGVLAIFIGIFNIRHLFKIRRSSINKNLALFENKLDLIFKKIVNPIGALALGFLSNLFLIPCASRPYLTTAKILSVNGASAKNILFLILYNIIFILPLITAMAIVYFGVRNKKIREWRSQKALLARSKLIYVIIGAVMIFTGVYLIQNWI